MVRNFRAAIEDWDEVCSSLGAWESKNLTDGATEENRHKHLAWVAGLLSWGRLVQKATQEPEFPDQALAARVNARIRHLEDKLSLWHRDMTPAREEEILRAAFK